MSLWDEHMACSTCLWAELEPFTCKQASRQNSLLLFRTGLGENKMTGMLWNRFCMIPLISEFLEHMVSHVENDLNKSENRGMLNYGGTEVSIHHARCGGNNNIKWEQNCINKKSVSRLYAPMKQSLPICLAVSLLMDPSSCFSMMAPSLYFSGSSM